MAITNATPVLLQLGTQLRWMILIDTSGSPQTTTASSVAVTGSDVDCALAVTLSYTITNSGGANGITWSVTAGNASDFSDEQTVQNAANVAFGATGTFTVTNPPYRYYRAKCLDQVGGSHSTVFVKGVAK